MPGRVAALTDMQAVAALRLVAQSWLSSDGVVAFGVVTDAREYIQSRSLDVPDWVAGNPPTGADMSDDEFRAIGDYCRKVLESLLNSDDPHAHGWADRAINKVTEPQPQVLETILLIKGAIMIAMLLAARVEKIDKNGVTFYQGLPKGLSSVLSARLSAFSASPANGRPRRCPPKR